MEEVTGEAISVISEMTILAILPEGTIYQQNLSLMKVPCTLNIQKR